MADTSRAAILFGLDVGTTTTSCLVASARLLKNCVTGRNEFGEVRPVFRPDPVFTPFAGESLDLEALARQLDEWLAAANFGPSEIVAGGALVTGLAARSVNAATVKQLVRNRFPQALVVATDDPCLESWLAFMGNAVALSRAEPERPFLNLDIGGGTTNVAWGKAGEVRRCGCYYVGARHIQLEPGTYRIRALSSFARELLAARGIAADVGRELRADEVTAVLDFYIGRLESAVLGKRHFEGQGADERSELGRSVSSAADASLERLHCQAAFIPPGADSIITLSGGVGELAYRDARGEPLPGTTAFGDLGIDLARRLCDSAVLGRHLKSHVPTGLGRATVQGLTIHSSEISGTTLYLPHPGVLPLNDVPILGTIEDATSDGDLSFLIGLTQRAAGGGCLAVKFGKTDTASVKALAERIARVLDQLVAPAPKAIVLLTAGDVGKTLGQYATRWGRVPVELIVIDEIPDRPAQFATLGSPQHGLVPVSFHGLAASLD